MRGRTFWASSRGGAGTATLLLLSGCMTAQLEEDRQFTTAIASHEAVVLLAKPHVEGITADRPIRCARYA